jgi:hypothetical protein
MLNSSSILFFFLFIYGINCDDDEILPEYVPARHQKPIMAISVGEEPSQEIRQSFEQVGAILCSFPEETLKTSPTLVVYCIILAILWLFLVITLCFGYIRQIIDRIRGLHGLSNNREHSMVDEERATDIQGVLSIGPAALLNKQIPLRNYNK